MSKDLKSYIKNGKNNKINKKHAESMAKELSQKSQGELNSQFEEMLAKSKANGTFNKEEMLSMLFSIKNNMPNGEYERIRSIIAKL